MTTAQTAINGQKINAVYFPGSGFAPIYEFSRIQDAGWIRIDQIGAENIYFTFKDDEGKECDGYCKRL